MDCNASRLAEINKELDFLLKVNFGSHANDYNNCIATLTASLKWNVNFKLYANDLNIA